MRFLKTQRTEARNHAMNLMPSLLLLRQGCHRLRMSLTSTSAQPPKTSLRTRRFFSGGWSDVGAIPVYLGWRLIILLSLQLRLR
ncbi:hypothetical protein BDN72DRAFT_574275 [Pluteus cervinus]|uniref:Uncharacterized protein n=1 Tax=Pluteus cervinus TaxID=181527 RepID=A0ACD3A2J1_9AGAR|nr:hypothetical protein BDN72DRAFT_574275 [Pluteus cervinus]